MPGHRGATGARPRRGQPWRRIGPAPAPRRGGRPRCHRRADRARRSTPERRRRPPSAAMPAAAGFTNIGSLAGEGCLCSGFKRPESAWTATRARKAAACTAGLASFVKRNNGVAAAEASWPISAKALAAAARTSGLLLFKAPASTGTAGGPKLWRTRNTHLALIRLALLQDVEQQQGRAFATDLGESISISGRARHVMRAASSNAGRASTAHGTDPLERSSRRAHVLRDCCP